MVYSKRCGAFLSCCVDAFLTIHVKQPKDNAFVEEDSLVQFPKKVRTSVQQKDPTKFNYSPTLHYFW